LALAAIPIAALPPQPGIAEAPSPPAPVSASTADAACRAAADARHGERGGGRPQGAGRTLLPLRAQARGAVALFASAAADGAGR